MSVKSRTQEAEEQSPPPETPLVQVWIMDHDLSPARPHSTAPTRLLHLRLLSLSLSFFNQSDFASFTNCVFEKKKSVQL